MKNIYRLILLLFIIFVAGQTLLFSQTASTTITYSGFQSCGGCTVCGADYWCTNSPGSYCGDTPPCITQTFFDPVPAGNTVTGVTINYWTASCVGAAIYGTVNRFAVPVAWDGSSGCLCSSLPCSLTTSVTASYPCGLPGYVYGGYNSFQLCSSASMCINRAEFIFSYYPTEVVYPTITPSGPTTFCPGQSVVLDAGSGFSAYHWSTGASSRTITATTSGTYTVTVTGVTGCTSNVASATVSVVDNQTPSITCPGNITVNNTTGTCSAVVNFSAPTGTDNCPNATTALVAGLPSGSSFPVGTTTNTYRVTDVSGKTNNCSFTVTVNDNQVPAITCPSNITVNSTSGTCGAAVTYTTPTGTDNCSGVSTTQIAGLASGATFPVGTTTNTFRVTDASGKTSTCSFTVTVIDNLAPSISCPSNIYVNNTSGICGAVVYYTAPVGTDNCTGAATTQTGGLASGSTFPVGVTTNTYRVTDATGQTVTCSFTVTVNDNQAPSITCPSNIYVNNTSGLCGAIVNFTAPAGTDNCPGASTAQTGGLASGSTFPVGVTTNTYRVTDATGKTSNCSFTITVTDNQNPSISCQNDMTVNATSGSCNAVVTYNAPVGTDNCSGANTALTAGLTSGSTFPVGTTTNTFRVTDATGRTSFCSFNITVVDNQPPAVSCPANISVNSESGACGATVTYTTPTGSDNCTGTTTTQTAGLASGFIFPVGTTTNTFTVTDAAGNTSTCSFTVTVTDNQAPQIVCPSNINVNNLQGSCGAVVNFTVPTGTDNCPGSVTTQISGLGSGATYPIGTTTNIFVVTDASGNTKTCSFIVNVSDNQVPNIICPSNITVNSSQGMCDAVVNYNPPVGTDNCPSAVTTQVSGLASGTTFPPGTTTNVFMVSDAAGNSNTCSFTVTVIDNQPPTIQCPADITMNCSPGMCGTIVNFSPPTGTDNCSGASTIQTSGLWSGYTFPVGVTTNVFEVSDAAGNTATCSFTVTVIDDQMPVVNCPSDITVNNNAGLCSAVVSYSNPIGSDNCLGVSTVQTAGLASGSAFPVGTTLNAFMVTDASGNTNMCSFTVTVNDIQPPTIHCPADTVTCNGQFNLVSATATDNCALSGIINNAPTVFPVGTTTVTWTATDVHGNTSICLQYVTISNITASATGSQQVTCHNGSDGHIAVTANGGTGSYSYQLNGGPLQTGNEFTGLTAGSYNIAVQDSIGCSTSLQFTIAQKPDMTVELISKADANCLGKDDGSLEIKVSGGTEPYIYLWSNEGVTPQMEGLDAGEYICTITDDDGCKKNYSVQIDAGVVEVPLKLNNVFSPNGDGINDLWVINNIELYPDNTLVVINRWGNEVYSEKGYKNTWDGSNLPEGTYFYVLKIDMCGADRTYKDYLTIVR